MAVTGEVSVDQKRRLNVEELKIGTVGTKYTLTGNDAAILDTLNTSDKLTKTVTGALLTGTGNAGMLSLLNPEGATIVITRLILDITTAATGTPTVDAGVTTVAASADDLIDGAAIGAAVVVVDNITDAGTNGLSSVKMGAAEYVTITASADPAGAVGSYYLSYFIV